MVPVLFVFVYVAAADQYRFNDGFLVVTPTFYDTLMISPLCITAEAMNPERRHAPMLCSTVPMKVTFRRRFQVLP